MLAVQRLARATRGDVQELLTLYALEGLLARIADSPYRDDLVLKGGVLLAAFDLRRPTRDIDLQATALANDVTSVLEQVRKIAGIDLADGLTFDLAGITAQLIREDDQYAGVRVRLVGALGRSRLTVGIDVNFGDPIWPHPQEIVVPRLVDVGQGPLRLLGYPLPMVVAEKVVTAIERGEVNTRWRDFADVLVIGGTHALAAGDLRAALEAVAVYREAELRPLLPTLASMPAIAERKWVAWRRRQAQAARLPESFAVTLANVAAFVDPVLRSETGDRNWNPRAGSWE
jgi:hypothetical protein